MSIKKSVMSASAFALATVLAVGGTYAYTSYQTLSLTNEHDMGIVEIEQLEYERAVDENGNWIQLETADKYGYYPDKLQEFTQNKLLIPTNKDKMSWDDRISGSHQQSWAQVGASGSNQLFDDSCKNVIDKFVFVKNTSTSDAKLRTVFAFEIGEYKSIEEFKSVIMLNTNAAHWSWDWNGEICKIGNNNYLLATATYLGPTSNPTGILAPDAVSYPSLLQFYMKSDVTKEMAEKIDGNGNRIYEIMVVSQACYESLELNDVFGKITAESNPWISGGEVFDEAGTYSLTKNINLRDGEATDAVAASGADVTVNILDGTYDAADHDCAVWAYDGATVNIYGGNYICDGFADVNSENHQDMIYAGSNGNKSAGYINIYDGRFESRNGAWLLNETDNLGEIVVYGGTFINWNPANNTSEGAGTNFLAPGYTVVETTEGENTIYTVVKG